MKILNLIKKKNYFVQINKEFQNLLDDKAKKNKEIIKKLNISRKTLYRIRKKENYWCNVKTLLDLIKELNIKKKELIKHTIKLKTKNSFSIAFNNFKLNTSLVRILGHVLGDGGIHIIEKEGKYRAFYTNKEDKLLKSFTEDIKKVFGDVKIYSRRRAHGGHEIWLPTTIGFLLNQFLNYEILNKNKRVPNFIFNIKDKKLAGAFLQALYDDDGFIYPPKNMIVISQKNKDLIADIRKVVSITGIKPNQILIHKAKKRTTMYYFSITHKDNFRIFDEFIGFKHPKKKEKLKILIKKCEDK